MMLWTLQAIWGFVVSSATLSTLIGCAAVAVAVIEPPIVARFVPHLRTAAIYTAIAAFCYSGVAGKFYHDGLAVKQGEWDRALEREAVAGEKARGDAERSVPDAADRRVFDADPNNRDRGKHAAEQRGPVRWLEGNQLLRR